MNLEIMASFQGLPYFVSIQLVAYPHPQANRNFKRQRKAARFASQQGRALASKKTLAVPTSAQLGKMLNRFIRGTTQE